MTMLRLIAYLIGLLTYPLRFALYLLHSCVYFLTKPGAAIILPLIVVAIGYTLYRNGNTLLDGSAVVVVAFFRGLFAGEIGETIHAWRGEITAIAAYLVVKWIVAAIGGMIQPLVHALPAPRRPFLPLTPLTIPQHVIRTEPASVVVRLPGRSHYRGNLADLQARLPSEIQAVLNARPAASANFTPRPMPAAPPSVAPAPPPSSAEPEREEMERPRPTPPAAARVPGRRPAPSSPEHSRGE